MKKRTKNMDDSDPGVSIWGRNIYDIALRGGSKFMNQNQGFSDKMKHDLLDAGYAQGIREGVLLEPYLYFEKGDYVPKIVDSKVGKIQKSKEVLKHLYRQKYENDSIPNKTEEEFISEKRLPHSKINQKEWGKLKGPDTTAIITDTYSFFDIKKYNELKHNGIDPVSKIKTYGSLQLDQNSLNNKTYEFRDFIGPPGREMEARLFKASKTKENLTKFEAITFNKQKIDIVKENILNDNVEVKNPKLKYDANKGNDDSDLKTPKKLWKIDSKRIKIEALPADINTKISKLPPKSVKKVVKKLDFNKPLPLSNDQSTTTTTTTTVELPKTPPNEPKTQTPPQSPPKSPPKSPRQKSSSLSNSPQKTPPKTPPNEPIPPEINPHGLTNDEITYFYTTSIGEKQEEINKFEQGYTGPNVKATKKYKELIKELESIQNDRVVGKTLATRENYNKLQITNKAKKQLVAKVLNYYAKQAQDFDSKKQYDEVKRVEALSAQINSDFINGNWNVTVNDYVGWNKILPQTPQKTPFKGKGSNKGGNKGGKRK